jgi:hypothetical protein
MNEIKSHSIKEVLDNSVFLRGSVPELKGATFKTARSSFPVRVGQISTTGDQFPYDRKVYVYLSGDVDYADAKQIGAFFTALAKRLHDKE